MMERRHYGPEKQAKDREFADMLKVSYYRDSLRGAGAAVFSLWRWSQPTHFTASGTRRESSGSLRERTRRKWTR